MNTLNDIASAVCIGAAGGAANYLWGLQAGKPFSVWRMLINVSTSGFMGLLIFWLGQGFHLDPSLVSFGSGVGGLLGTRLVDIIEASLRKQLGVDHDDTRHQEQEPR